MCKTPAKEKTRAHVDCGGPFSKSVFGNGSGHHMNEVCCGLRSDLALQHRSSIYEAYEGYAMCMMNSQAISHSRISHS